MARQSLFWPGQSLCGSAMTTYQIKWLLHFIPILFLIPFILHLFNIYSTLTYFSSPVTVGMHAEGPAQAHQADRKVACMLP